MRARAWLSAIAVAAITVLIGPHFMALAGESGSRSWFGDTAPLVHAQSIRQSVERRTLNIGGLERTYYLYVPDRVRGTRPPLVVAFHGGGADAIPWARRIGLQDMADRYGFVMALPEGLQESWNTGSIDPQGYAEENGIDDLTFVSQLLDDVLANGLADPRRVFAMGGSRGGMMAYHAACSLPDRFAAIAVVSGTLSSGTCPHAQGVSLLHIHGTADDRVPFEGGRGQFTPRGQAWPSAQEGILTFAQNAQCSSNWQASQVTDDTACSSVACPGSDEVEYCLIEGGGHAWPGTETTLRQRLQGASSSRLFDATTFIAEFFLQH